MAQKQDGAPKGASPLQESLQTLAGTFAQRAVTSASNRMSGTTQRLTDYAQNGGGSGLIAAATGTDKLLSGDSPVKAAVAGGLSGAKEKVKETVQNVTGAITGKSKGGGKGLKVTNIVEQIDVGVPVELAYRQWTQFADFPKFMKKVEQVEQVSDEKLTWKAQIFLSHRSWESTITEQVPNERIVWRSKGDKGYVDGAITFHELAPRLTRVIVVLEYHPQGLFERTGNLWRAQGRRVRLELKHFQRHVMAYAVLNAEDIDGWTGEIRDGEVVSDGAREPEERESESPAAVNPEPDNEESPPPKRRRTVSRKRDASNGGSPARRAAKPQRSRA
ncbi:cyclase [Mycobacterium sp. IS-1496]|uniref:SRPBCC family protein n=1 Tax=Mycobacterium sp. IS-1496 TaxID=1772284 RepID=UPI000741567F|nr:SRPBCC family protein [Mycobacterium sp. IS-1496]KUI36183.1 cyclase [Mycobacterium sp. IS-1496]